MKSQNPYDEYSSNFDKSMALIMQPESLDSKKIFKLIFDTFKILSLGAFFLGGLALASYSGFDAPGRLTEYCAESTWHCPVLLGWQAPWWFWIRSIQVLFLPPLLSLSIPWLVNHKHWEMAWWGYAFYFFAFGSVITLIGETLIMTGLPTRFGGWVVLLDTCLLIFMLSLAFWNQDLLEKFGGLEKVSKRMTGIGIGILAVLGVAVGRLSAENGENALLVAIGIVITPWIIVLSGKEWTQTLWHLSPWRVKAALRQRNTKRGNDDER